MDNQTKEVIGSYNSLSIANEVIDDLEDKSLIITTEEYVFGK